MYDNIKRALEIGCTLSVQRQDDGKILASIANDATIAGMMSHGDTINTALSHLDRHVRESLARPKRLA